METLTDKQARKLFSESFQYRGLIKELSDYQINKVLSLVKTDIQKEVNAIVEMINTPKHYNYPKDVDETRLFEYWADRINSGYYNKLKEFEEKLYNEIRSRKLQLTDDITLEEKFNRIDQAELSRVQIAKFIEKETSDKKLHLEELLKELNSYALEFIVSGALEKFRPDKHKEVIKEKLEASGYDSFENGWEIVLEVLEPFQHMNLVVLKELIEEKINEPEKHSLKEQKVSTLNYDVSSPGEIANDMASKNSCHHESKTIHLFLEAVLKNKNISAEKQREKALEAADDATVISELTEVPSSTLYTWRKKVLKD